MSATQRTSLLALILIIRMLQQMLLLQTNGKGIQDLNNQANDMAAKLLNEVNRG